MLSAETSGRHDLLSLNNSLFQYTELFLLKHVLLIESSRMTYIIVLVFVAVVVADHRLGLPSALPLLAFVMAARLFTQLDLNPH